MENFFVKLIEPKNGVDESRKLFSNGDLKRLIVPVIVEQFLSMLVGLADTLMISYAGEAAVSGVSLVNQLVTIFIMIFMAVASGGTVVVSQYIGSGDKKKSVSAANQLVMITTAVSIIMMAAVLLSGDPIFRLLFGKVEEDVYDSGMIYLRISALSFPFLAIYNGCAGIFRSMEKTRTLMYVSVVMNGINIAGNAVGIFVLHAGAAGVAVPSLISRFCAAAVMLVLTLDRKNAVYITFHGIFSWNGGMIKRIIGIGFPNSIENGLFQASKVALSSITALFGTVQIAASGVAQSLWVMSALFCMAMAPVFITVIGRIMGAGDTECADYYARKLLRITYIGSAAWNLFFLLITPPILLLYDLSAETERLVIIIVIIHNFFNAAFCPLSFSLSNGLRAAGDVKFTMYSSIFSSVVCRVVFSVIFALKLNMGVIGITLAMGADWVVKAVLVAARYRSGKWQHFKVI
ncbi:MAG: MATE family efflux transporter [Huintestinicola sp.]